MSFGHTTEERAKNMTVNAIESMAAMMGYGLWRALVPHVLPDPCEQKIFYDNYSGMLHYKLLAGTSL